MNKFKTLSSSILLATSLALTSCGQVKNNTIVESESVEREFDATSLSDSINSIVSSGIETVSEAIQNYDEFAEERSKFERTVGHYEYIYTDEFKACDNLTVSWNAAANHYELESNIGENVLQLNLPESDLINFLLHQMNCEKLIIKYDVNDELLSSLTTCDTIKTVIISDSNISSLEGLSCLTNLEELSINNCSKITDLTPLENLTNMERIGINGSNISDVSPLAKLPNLSYLNLRCNKISNPEVLSVLDKLDNICLEFNCIENKEQLDFLVDKGIYTEEQIESIVDTSTKQFSFAIGNYQEEAKVLYITYLDSKEAYYVEMRNDNQEIVKYALVDDLFNLYGLTDDTPNCTGIKLSNIPEDFYHVSIANEENYNSMVIDHCDIDSLFFVDDFKNLTYLAIDSCPNLTDPFVSPSFNPYKLNNLKTLIVKGTNISNFNNIVNFRSLEAVELRNNNIEDFGFLMYIPTLKAVFLGIDNYPVDARPLETIQENGVIVSVTGYYLPPVEEVSRDEEIEEEVVEEDYKEYTLEP